MLAREIEEVALLRLQVGAGCFERYRRCLITQPDYACSVRDSTPLLTQPVPASQVDVVLSQKALRNVVAAAELRQRQLAGEPACGDPNRAASSPRRR